MTYYFKKLYKFKSPYVKGEYLPFMIMDNSGYVQSIEQKGMTKYKSNSHYENVNDTIQHCKMEEVNPKSKEAIELIKIYHNANKPLN